MKNFRLIILIAGLMSGSAGSAQAKLVVNEVLADEPGGSTSLEWFEIYNNAPVDVNLATFLVQVNGQTLNLPGVLPAYQYLVVCHKLYGDGGSPAFEEVWGDGSGVWGDDSRESYPEPVEISFPILTNTGGTITIRKPDLSIVSSLSWPDGGGDGISWELESDGGSRVMQSVDPLGATPGMVNSLTPLGHDLALEDVTAGPDDRMTRITLYIVNRSLAYVSAGSLHIYRINESDSTDITDTVATAIVPALDSGSVTDIIVSVTLPDMYAHLGASLGPDDRDRNNHWTFWAPGSQYPPVILTEVLARPTGLLVAEWVEIQSQVDTVVDLQGWYLGDALTSKPISDTTLGLQPGGYMILTNDSAGFREFYPHALVDVFQPASTVQFNNTGDAVRLLDYFGLRADQVVYDRTYDSNYSWCRAETADGSPAWGRSLEPGGSPGEDNQVLLEPTGSVLSLSVRPKVFSPNGDGYEDIVAISIVMPEAPSYTMKILDRSGRVVRTFLDGDELLRPDDVDGERFIWIWDGHDDRGQRLGIGLYILYFEATGLESAKTSVVIAR